MNTPVVLITGALTGIGRATAIAFARQGANLVVSGRREEAGRQLAAELRGLGARAEFVRADVRHESEVRDLVAAVIQHFGRLDVAVNNAGTEGTQGPIGQQTVENYQATFDTNVLGTLLSLKYELPLMLAQGSGSIINISSIAGQIGFAGAAIYTASKHAVEGLTKAAALEAASAGVRVNAIAPGPVATEMLDRFTGGDADAKSGLIAAVPAGRAARIEEIADAILFLAGDKSTFLTGQAINVDGGYTAQ
jgi:NAD(P)-dependent dehydrogenase (short-subunit alcohol dehydrogenase family)